MRSHAVECASTGTRLISKDLTLWNQRLLRIARQHHCTPRDWGFLYLSPFTFKPPKPVCTAKKV